MYLPIFLRSDAARRESLTALTVAVLANYSDLLLLPDGDRTAAGADRRLARRGLYRWLIGIDTPANCFPSGHITAPAIGCWYLGRQRLRWWRGIAASTPCSPCRC